MRLHWLQHVPFEGLGLIEEWGRQPTQHSIVWSQTAFFENDWVLPDPHTVDGLIVMGGPMSVGDTDSFPWLAAEQAFIREFIATGKPILGVCLGAQLIAAAAGANIERNAHAEIGWWPLDSVANYRFGDDWFGYETFVPLHWHGDTFVCPAGAELIASSAATQNQAFVIQKNIIGLQFHLESDASTVELMLKHAADDLRSDSHWVQSADDIRFGLSNVTGCKRALYYLLNQLFGSV